jgi:hypothetical protein
MSLLADYYTEDQLAAELKTKTGTGGIRTPRAWRERRVGPPWAKIGRAIVYPHDGFERWLRSQVQEPTRNRRAA